MATTITTEVPDTMTATLTTEIPDMADTVVTTEIPDIQIQVEKKIEDVSLSSSGNGSDSDKENLDLDSKIRLIPRSRKKGSFDSISSNDGEENEVQLTAELRTKIIAQAEHYFSNENLSKDGFLFKHVKRNKEGFVNLTLLASFKKMRSLCRDLHVIGEAIKSSSKLVVSENGLKIRRVDPLPKELLEQARVKYVVISNMLEANPSMDYVIAAFPGHEADVVSIRVVKPDTKIPNDLQCHFARYPELKIQIVAVIEFDSPQNAAAAISHVDRNQYPDIDVKVLEVGQKQAKRMSNNNSESAASDTPSESGSIGLGRKVKKKTNNRLLDLHGREDSHSSHATSSSDSDWSSFNSCSTRYNRSRGNNSPSPSTPRKSRSSNESAPNGLRSKSSGSDSPRSPQKRIIDNSPMRKISPLAGLGSPRSSPEVLRKLERKADNKGEQLNSWMHKRMQLSKNNENDTLSQKHLEIIRQPKGPDGTFGFSSHPLTKYRLVHAC